MDQLSKEIHKPRRKNFQRRKVIVYDIDDVWGADLVDMQEWADKNKGFKYMLTVIDVFSKYAYVVKLKTKKGLEMKKAFRKLFKNGKPKNLWVDKGSEFYNKDVKKFLKDNKVNMYSTYGDSKSAVVERFNRTLKEKMWKKFTERQTRVWIDMIDDLVGNYFNTMHSTIGFKPNEAHKHVDEIRLVFRERRR